MSKVKKLLDKLVKKCGAITSPASNNANKFAEIKNLPQEYLEFMNLTDGLGLSVSEILDTSDGEYSFVETNKQYKKEFLDAFAKDFVADDYSLFATDGMGGYYAFSAQENNEKVYYFDHEFSDDLKTYKSFIHFLKDLIKQEIELNKE